MLSGNLFDLLHSAYQYEPQDCLEKRDDFEEYGIPVVPTFDENCRFDLKQCNDEKCWCVKAGSGEPTFGEVPLGEDYDCSSKKNMLSYIYS